MSYAIFRVARLHKTFAGQLLRETGLYPGQELLMMRLWDAGPQRQIDLVRSLDSDAPTMTRTVSRLERAGFVRRVRSATDRRTTIIEATRASLSLRKAVERVWADLEGVTVGALDVHEQDEVLESLAILEENLIAAEDSVMRAEGRRPLP